MTVLHRKLHHHLVIFLHKARFEVEVTRIVKLINLYCEYGKDSGTM